tara:strand:- start:45 stop:167 length:123 start_codon:yes stop_codon:yes gene_type:complete
LEKNPESSKSDEKDEKSEEDEGQKKDLLELHKEKVGEGEN